ncbi:MAG: CCC motif membrane protein [Maribacter sp.]
MEQQKLPNVTIILVLGIASIILCWCYGVLGLILSIVALILAASSKKVYLQSPENYIDYGSLKTAKIIAIIGLILNILLVLFFAWAISAIGWDVIQSGDEELIRERMEELMGQ